MTSDAESILSFVAASRTQGRDRYYAAEGRRRERNKEAAQCIHTSFHRGWNEQERFYTGNTDSVSSALLQTAPQCSDTPKQRMQWMAGINKLVQEHRCVAAFNRAPKRQRSNVNRYLLQGKNERACAEETGAKTRNYEICS